ncbi:hypothetical protein ACFQ05_25745 [Amycolatopsis umgeniensis]|uniref:Uncharacterized protein n=1 Tax=Amycolatopsis umgeniensis TaxID=336628 RepID=A0A841BBQ6_9PSEU|nr:hypothetical protein [Amycolatopsis umgeniensis]MBB5856283.1 hypothetical protein [Amycolatopsis umgeniensis]
MLTVCLALTLTSIPVTAAAQEAGTAGVRAPFCYEEPVQPKADVSDIKAGFQSSKWLQTIQAVYKRRWPSGEGLAIAQAKDKYFSQFVTKTSFNGLAESLMVAIHEETHMWDLDPSRTSWDVYMSAWINNSRKAMKVPLHGGFPRREILPLITDKLTDSMDGIYLRDQQQGSYRMQGVMAELNAGLMGLPAATVVAEYIQGVGASNSRDIAATNIRYLLLYLRVAKARYPDYWAKAKAQPELRELVLVEFLRAAYWLDQSAPYASKLGSADVDKIVAKNYAPENIAILEEFTGAKVNTSTQKNCST